MPRTPTSTRLNRTAVIEAAEVLVDAHGWTELTMTALAGSLDVRVPTLYSHVDNLDDLLTEIQIRAHAAMANGFQAAAAGRSGADGFRRTAVVQRDFARHHPGLYDLAMAAPRDIDAVLRAAAPSRATLAALVESFGITEPSWDLIMNVVATVHGVIALDRTGLFAGAADVDVAYDRAVETVIAMLEREGGGTA